MKKERGKLKVTKVETIEIVLALVITVLLLISLLSSNFAINVPFKLTSWLLLAFILIKGFNTIIRKNNIIEDYVALVIIGIFWIIYFILQGQINSIVIISAILILLYSIGLVIWVKSLFRSKNVLSFIVSYAIFVVIVIILFSGAYFENSSQFKLDGQPTQLTFEETIYFSTITFTTVGYGDISPTGINQLIATTQAIIGTILNIAFMGYILASRRFSLNEERKDSPIVLVSKKSRSKK
jgi:hypothetical protein